MLRKRLFGTRRAAVVSIAVIALIASGVGYAAWSVFSGTSGNSTQSSFATATTTTAVAISPCTSTTVQASDYITGPGGTGNMCLKLTNNSTSAENITGLTSETFTTTPAACASHLSFNTSAFMTQEATLEAGEVGGKFQPAEVREHNYTGVVSADSTLPVTCSAGTWQVALVGTTNP